MQDGPVVYRIRIKGCLDQAWSDWFGGLTVATDENGDTEVSGPVVDQAALHGLLRKVRDLGLPLLSVTCDESGKGKPKGKEQS